MSKKTEKKFNVDKFTKDDITTHRIEHVVTTHRHDSIDGTLTM